MTIFGWWIVTFLVITYALILADVSDTKSVSLFTLQPFFMEKVSQSQSAGSESDLGKLLLGVSQDSALTLEKETTDCPIEAVTVYNDRAEVKRKVQFNAQTAGVVDIVVNGLGNLVVLYEKQPMQSIYSYSAPLPSNCKSLPCEVLPPPPLPVTEYLPIELRYAEEYRRQLRQAEKSQSHERIAMEHKPSFTESLKTSLKDTSKTIQDEFTDVNTKQRGHSEASHFATEESFRSHFRLPWDERLWDGFHCKAIVSPGFNRSGICYISDSYFSFYSMHKHQHVSFMLPLREIVSYRAGVVSGRKHLKQIIAADQPTTMTKGLIIYTSDHMMHRLYNFSHDSRDVYNVLDHAWHLSKNSQLPLPLPISLNVMFPPRPAYYKPYDPITDYFVSQTEVSPEVLQAARSANAVQSSESASAQNDTGLLARNNSTNDVLPQSFSEKSSSITPSALVDAQSTISIAEVPRESKPLVTYSEVPGIAQVSYQPQPTSGINAVSPAVKEWPQSEDVDIPGPVSDVPMQ